MENTTHMQQLADQLNISNLSEEQQDMVINTVMPGLVQALLVRSINVLSPEKYQEFNSKIEQGLDAREILPYLAEHVPNFTDILSSEIEHVQKNVDLILGR